MSNEMNIVGLWDNGHGARLRITKVEEQKGKSVDLFLVEFSFDTFWQNLAQAVRGKRFIGRWSGKTLEIYKHLEESPIMNIVSFVDKNHHNNQCLKVVSEPTFLNGWEDAFGPTWLNGWCIFAKTNL